MKIKPIFLIVVLALSAFAQQFPANGYVRLTSGKYTLFFLPTRALALSGFAYDGTQLFVSDAASADVAVTAGKEKPVLLEAKLTVDGQVPEKVGTSPVSGKKLVLERTFRQGGITVQESTTLTEEGAVQAVKYKATGETRPSSVCLFTFPWHTEFTECVTDTGNKAVCADGGDWLIQSNPQYIAMHREDKGVGVIYGLETAVPLTSRKQAIWDHKAYHKYFLFHRLPEWKVGYESPEYRMRLKAFSHDVSKWQEIAHNLAGQMPFVNADAAPAGKPAANGKAAPAAKAATEGKRLNKVEILPPGPVSGRMDWKTNRRGIEALDPDFVLPPFEPVQATQKSVKVWNREYAFGGNGLITRARIKGRDILVNPMRLEMVINGKPVVFRTKGARLVSSHKGVAVYETPMESDEATALVKATVEYDGMVRIDLTLTPKKEITLDHFSYAFHMANTRAKYIHFIGNPSVSGLSIMIPKESFSFEIPNQKGEFFAEPFKTLVWFGDEDEGFLWFSGSEKNFSPAAPEARPKALTASREFGTSKSEGTTTFTVTPVSKPVKTAKPLEYTFGFFATPVRPMPKGWRTWFFTTRRAKYGSESGHGYVGNMPMIWPDETRSTAAPLFSKEAEEKMKRYAAELHKAGKNVLGYMDPIRVHMGYLKYLGVKINTAQLNDLYLAPDPKNDEFLYRVPVVSENFKEWRTLPEVIYSYGASKGGREVRVSSASSWADFFCYLCECYAKLGYDGMGDIDNCFPIRDMNRIHGRGFTGLDGKEYYEWDWFERRDLMKRMSAVFLKELGKPGILVAHSSATWSIPFISFCDANMTYEHSNSGYFASDSFMSKYNPETKQLREKVQAGNPDFLRHAFPTARWRAELTGRQFGIPCVMMSNLTKSGLIPKEAARSLSAARAITAGIAAHDIIMWPIWCNTAPMVTLQKIRERFGLGADDVEYLPYWSQKLVTATAPFSLTVYRRPGKALVVVSNLTDKPLEGNVDFSALKLNNITDAESGKPASGQGLSIPASDYRIFELK